MKQDLIHDFLILTILLNQDAFQLFYFQLLQLYYRDQSNCQFLITKFHLEIYMQDCLITILELDHLFLHNLKQQFFLLKLHILQQVNQFEQGLLFEEEDNHIDQQWFYNSKVIMQDSYNACQPHLLQRQSFHRYLSPHKQMLFLLHDAIFKPNLIQHYFLTFIFLKLSFHRLYQPVLQMHNNLIIFQLQLLDQLPFHHQQSYISWLEQFNRGLEYDEHIQNNPHLHFQARIFFSYLLPQQLCFRIFTIKIMNKIINISLQNQSQIDLLLILYKYNKLISSPQQMEKQQSRSVEQLSFQQLLQMGEEKLESFDNQEAEYFFELAYKKNPFNQVLVLLFANVLKQNQKINEAKQVLQKSIKDVPNGTYKRFFELGQIYNGVEAIKIFQQGIQQAMKNLKNPFKTVTPQKQIKRNIAQAYASIAEVCLTDLLQEPQAEVKCLQAFEKGKKSDNNCMDIHLQMANYFLYKQNSDQARSELELILNNARENKQEYDQDLLLQTSKYFIQLQMYKASQELLQMIHQNESNQPETIYLLAYCAFKLQRYEQCEDYIEQFQNGQKDFIDEQLQEGMKQLIQEMKKMKKDGIQTNENQDDEWMDVQGEGNEDDNDNDYEN